MKIGDSIKWTATDESGKFSHVGVVEKVNEKWVDFRTKKDGLMSIRLVDGTFEVVQVADTSLDTSVVSEKPNATSPSVARTGSKLERAILLVKANPEATPAQLKQMFIDQLEMTTAGAQTYVYTARKAVANAV